MKVFKRLCAFTCAALCCAVCCYAQRALPTELKPASLAAFRDAMYADPLNHESLRALYEQTKADILASLSDYDMYVAQSRLDYYMGRSYSYAQNKTEAASFYDRSLENAEKALAIRQGPEALLIQGESLSQNCAVKPTSYALANGLRVGKIAKQVLDADPKNGAARYLLSAQHIYAPSPFNNYRRGIKEMQEILDTSGIRLENDDLFNITSALAYVYIRQEKYDDALPWIQKALEVYPTNFFALSLQEQILSKRKAP